MRQLRPGPKAALLVSCALGALALPLLFHRSEHPAIGPYGRGYAVALTAVAAAIVAVALLVARACRRRDDLMPAYALLVSVGGLAGALALGEAALRLRAPDAFASHREWGSERSIYFGFHPKPSHAWSNAGASYATDRWTFRRHATEPDWAERPPRPGEVRLFVMGESSTFGYGLDDDDTWAHQLQASLASELPGVPVLVVNAGANGFNSLQSLLRFHLDVSPHAPTHVLFYGGRNDVSPVVRRNGQVREGLEDEIFSTTVHDFLDKRHARRNYYLRSNTYHTVSGLLQKPLARLRGEKPAPPAMPAGYDEVLRHNGKAFHANVTALADMCRRAEAKLFLTTFIYDPARIGPRFDAGIRHYNEVLRTVAARETLPLIDLEQKFAPVEAKHEYFFEDAYHPAPPGATFIARQVADGLLASDEGARWRAR
jgi:lysophospholipase L1-like esterase